MDLLEYCSAPVSFEKPPAFAQQAPSPPPRDPYRDLADAIILQTVSDYRRALRSLRRKPGSAPAQERAARLEQFFRSAWYRTLTDLDGEMLIRRLKKEE